jgi:hypothetical protein
MRNAFTALLTVGAVAWVVGAFVAASENGRESDIVRQWIVCQYVNAGVNPYPLARDILLAKFGAGNPGRVKVYAIPKDVPVQRAGEVSPELGPPEATYPPPAIGLLALTVGLLLDAQTVLVVWFAVNVAAAGGVAVGLTRMWPVPPGGGTEADNLRLVLAALLLFPAAYSTLVTGQFSLLVLGLLLLANDPSRGWLPRGVALGVALLKPTVALPFLFLPLVRREWRVLLAAVAIQAAATLYVAWQTGELAGMFLDWLTVASFFLQGMYTLQDWLNVVSPRLPWLVPAASLGVLIFCGITLAIARHLPRTRLIAVTAVTSVFWTYHASYDFVVLLPVLLPLAGWSDAPPGKRWSALGLVLFAVLALALLQVVIGGDDPATKMIRWAARVVVIGLVVWEYLRIYLSVFRPENTPNPPSEGDAEPVPPLHAPSSSG